MKQLVVVAGLAAVLLGVAGCGGGSTPGQPTPATTTASDATTGSSPSTGAQGASLPADQPCSLLSASDLQQAGASSPPTQEMVGTAHSCEFTSSDYSVIVGIRTNVGLSGFQSSGGKVTAQSIGSHQAKQELDSPTCTIAIGVSDSSRVDVTVTAIFNADPCQGAADVAKLVEPKLP